jgi:molybdate transport system substrate-binding protein
LARFRPIVLLAALIIALAACSTDGAIAGRSGGASPSGQTSGAGAGLTVFGAASLKGALERAKVAWEATHPGSVLTISTDSSAALETQIEQGAPADVFLAADTTNPQKVVDRGLAAGPALPFAANELAVIVPTANAAGVSSPMDLARPGVKLIAAGDAVPITTYAAELVAGLSREPGYPADFAAAYAANIRSKEDNVKAIVAKIELGEGDAGIVYVTDAKASTKVASVPVPAAANVAAAYAGVVLQASPSVATARAFLDWLAGPDGQAILAGFGFRSPP